MSKNSFYILTDRVLKENWLGSNVHERVIYNVQLESKLALYIHERNGKTKEQDKNHMLSKQQQLLIIICDGERKRENFRCMRCASFMNGVQVPWFFYADLKLLAIHQWIIELRCKSQRDQSLWHS